MSSKIEGNVNVGLVVLSWNNADLLPACFESIKHQTYPGIRTVLVDNASSDNTVELTHEKYPWVEVAQAGKNGGFTAGNNLGIKKLMEDESIDYVILLNSDATLSTTWVEKMVKYAQFKPKAAFMQGTTLDYYDHEVVDSTHIYVAQNGQATQGSWRTLYEGDKAPMRVYGTNAAACLITRKFIEAQPFDEFFDESFFMYLEDVDSCTRAVVTGWDNYYVPGALAYHMGSATSGKTPGFSLYMTYRNNLAMLFKNLPFRIYLRLLPRVMMSDYRTIKGLLKKGRWMAVRRLLQGRLVGVVRTPLYIRKRGAVRRLAGIDENQLWLLMKKGY